MTVLDLVYLVVLQLHHEQVFLLHRLAIVRLVARLLVIGHGHDRFAEDDALVFVRDKGQNMAVLLLVVHAKLKSIANILLSNA